MSIVLYFATLAVIVGLTFWLDLVRMVAGKRPLIRSSSTVLLYWVVLLVPAFTLGYKLALQTADLFLWETLVGVLIVAPVLLALAWVKPRHVRVIGLDLDDLNAALRLVLADLDPDYQEHLHGASVPSRGASLSVSQSDSRLTSTSDPLLRELTVALRDHFSVQQVTINPRTRWIYLIEGLVLVFAGIEGLIHALA